MKKIILTLLSMTMLAGSGSLHAVNVGVPAECEDVMLQVFYWNSHQLTKYGRTKWIDLQKDSTAIAANFDVVWFPPSASSKGGVGYYHACLSNQDSEWGSRTVLEKLIAALHRGGTKVLGDIVINHRGNKSNWCDFWQDNFGQYGTFQLTQQHICYGDECFTTSGSSCYNASASNRGATDSGTNDGGARDLDHKSEYVQNWAKAYTKWMRNIMKYDGFRYDMTRGYAGSYLKLYNEYSNPYMSVSEFWMDDITSQVNHLKATDYNTMVFDFAQRSKVNTALKYPNYRLLINHTNSFRYQGLSRYAVTFIDNHDTFERDDNKGGEFIGYNIDLQNASNKNKLLQANAYILMLPGVPCVFWPHWKSYQNEINALIAVRKQAGIHSESAVEESVDTQTNTYEAAIQGHNGRVILRMGANRSKDVPAGYVLALEGGDAADYTIFYAAGAQGVVTVNGEGRMAKGEKFMKNGELYIRVNGQVFDILGRKKHIKH